MKAAAAAAAVVVAKFSSHSGKQSELFKVIFFFLFITTTNENVSNAKPLFDIRLYLNCNQLSLIAHKLIPKLIIVVIVDTSTNMYAHTWIFMSLCVCV